MNADFDAVVYTCPITCSTRPSELRTPSTTPSTRSRRARGTRCAVERQHHQRRDAEAEHQIEHRRRVAHDVLGDDERRAPQDRDADEDQLGAHQGAASRALDDGRARELVGALVLGDAGVAVDLDQPQVAELARRACACARRAPGWPSPSSPCRGARARTTSRRAATTVRSRGTSSSARTIAISSAMLLVPTPRYSRQLAPLAAVEDDDAEAGRARDCRCTRRRCRR